MTLFVRNVETLNESTSIRATEHPTRALIEYPKPYREKKKYIIDKRKRTRTINIVRCIAVPLVLTFVPKSFKTLLVLEEKRILILKKMPSQSGLKTLYEKKITTIAIMKVIEGCVYLISPLVDL